MTSTAPHHGPCRIVIGLKAACEIDAPVSAATTLATVVNAEIVGLYVEETAMIDLAGLPFARAFSVGAAQPRELTREAMEQAISQGAQMCRRALSSRAEKAQIKWSFTCEPGDLSEKAKSALSAGDFFVVPSELNGLGVSKMLNELRDLPSYVRGIVVTGSKLREPARGPVIAVDDGDATGEKTISLAARIAAVTHEPLMLFAVAATDAQVEQIIRRAHKLAGPVAPITVHRFLPDAPQSIAAAFMHFTPSFVVADLEGEPFGDDQIARQLFRAARAPVILVRAK